MNSTTIVMDSGLIEMHIRLFDYAQMAVRDGNDWVVDCDLEAFFDNVNHDLLMTQLRSRHKDVILLRLINRYLKAGVCINGMKQASLKGVPQGGQGESFMRTFVRISTMKSLETLRNAQEIVVFIQINMI